MIASQAASEAELTATVARMEARLSASQFWSLYRTLALRFENDLSASPRDTALAKSAALMLLQAVSDLKPAVGSLERDSEYYTAEGCFITELANTPDDPDASIALARVAHGITTRWHRLIGTAERYVIIGGRGRVEIGDLPAQEVTAGDVVLIPPLCRQRITNLGAEDLTFLAICTPRFEQRNYEDVEKP